MTGWGYAGATGLEFTAAPIVDAHFAACAPAYEELAREAGFRPGWHVLDAGCGSGSFLPVLADLVGPAGAVTAIDLDPSNVDLALRRSLPCSLSTELADVRRLPFPDGTFDAVWCANTTQYLDDAALALACAEFARVVRPGGIVALKDLDATLVSVHPGDPFLFTDYFRLSAPVHPYTRQLLRTRRLHHWLASAGLADVRQRTVLIEHFAPIPQVARNFYNRSCATFARQALELGAPGEWSVFLDPAAPSHPLNAPDAYLAEGNVLAVGAVPRR